MKLFHPAQFSLSRHGHPVQNGGIFFVSKSLGEPGPNLRGEQGGTPLPIYWETRAAAQRNGKSIQEAP